MKYLIAPISFLLFSLWTSLVIVVVIFITLSHVPKIGKYSAWMADRILDLGHFLGKGFLKE